MRTRTNRRPAKSTTLEAHAAMELSTLLSSRLLTLAGEDLGPFLAKLVEDLVDLLLLFLGF